MLPVIWDKYSHNNVTSLVVREVCEEITNHVHTTHIIGWKPSSAAETFESPRGGMLFLQEVCFSTGFARKNVCKVSEVLGFNQGMIGLCREFCLLGMFNRRACINNYSKREIIPVGIAYSHIHCGA